METVKEGNVGKAVVRLVKTATRYAGLVIADGKRAFLQEGSDPDELWRLAHDAAGKSHPSFSGYPGARKRFLSFFPEGFKGADYLDHERAYKLDAKRKLDATVPLEQAAIELGFGEQALASFRATNLLFSIEKAKLQELLRGSDADAFVQASAIFAAGDEQGFRELKSILKRHDQAKWTVATYLPFLWRPDSHFFLKPTMLQRFAERVGHRFANDYSAELDLAVYQSLLDMAAEAKREIADLEPQDMIDIQSFMWTAVEYTEADRDDYEGKP